MVKPVDINEQQFEETVLKSKKPVLVDFWAPWCRPCLMLAPVIEELSGEYHDKVIFTKLDVDQNSKTASSYQVMSIPTVLVFKNGAPVSHMVGYKSKEEMKKELDAVLEK